MSNELKEAALRYAEKGLAVFPVIPKDKKPLTENGFKNATTDKSKIEEWWTIHPDANIGVATGEMSGGLVVIDMDIDKDKDKDGYHCWCIVRFLTDIEDDDYHKHIGLEEKMPQLKDFDGYFAGVSFASSSEILRDLEGNIIPLSERFTGKAPLYRGDGMYVRFTGIKRVYVAP